MSELEISIGLLLCVVVCAYYRIKPKMMSKKELIEKYYKTNTIVHHSENRYSKEYVMWLERKLLRLLNQNKDDIK